MSDARWFRNDVDWWEQEWILPLSSEAKHCYNLLLCRIGAVGQHGRAKKTPVMSLARQWFVGEESVRQMLIAAIGAGAIIDDGEYWGVDDPTIYSKDPTVAERVRRHRESKKGQDVTNVTLRNGCNVGNATIQDNTDNTDNTPPTPSRGKFVKPSEAECREFAETLKMPSSEGSKFFNYWESSGWLRGKTRMKDWKASMRTWNANYQERVQSGNGKNQGSAPRRTLNEVTLAQ